MDARAQCPAVGERLEPAPGGSRAAYDALAPTTWGHDCGPHVPTRRQSTGLQSRRDAARRHN
eukprot:7014035-Lingulodinium_polyedra.AAC.1